jgi:hypothetical protein
MMMLMVMRLKTNMQIQTSTPGKHWQQLKTQVKDLGGNPVLG